MKASLRARRMARNHKRQSQQARLSLVSLMDIFTILVFFLMVNGGDVEVLQADKNITLPESMSEQSPEITLTIKISADAIVVQGRKIESVKRALAQTGNAIKPLTQELKYQSTRGPELTEREKKLGRSIIIMGDQGMPHKLLKRVMSTCADSDYRDIALAVNSSPTVQNQQPPASGV
jgi:biopolymer transport protein ExbD